MYAHTLKNGKSSKYDIQKSLARANNGNAENFKACPVFKVLVNKKMVIRTKQNNEWFYQCAKIDQLTKNEIADLVKICQESKMRYESK